MRYRLVLPFVMMVALVLAVGVRVVQAVDLDCLIEAHVVVAVSAPLEGVLETVAVDRGDLVKEGQVLATLESKFERATVAVNRARAELASKRLAELELQRAIAELELRTIRSPITGVVRERLLSKGEFAKQNPILRLAQIDPLRVEVFAPVSMLGEITVGMTAQVMPESPVKGTYSARVTIVDQVVDAASGTFGVRLELPNAEYRLPAGLKCKVRFLKEASRKGAR
jgi:multidrug efflux pump subunit AcrA (membrane-fusion protein)